MYLTYRPHAQIEDLQENECTLHRAGDSNGNRWWMLWFNVRREDNGQLEDLAVAVAPGGSFTEGGPGGRTWGLTKTSSNTWEVSPSINVVDHKTWDRMAGQESIQRVLVNGPVPEPFGGSSWNSVWHQTPIIFGVPDGEPWIPR